jgi:myo-inositol-1(or 4)-monophosphatase
MDIASRIIRDRLPSVVSAKGDRDMVSDIDVEIEQAVRGYLHEQDPEIGFVGEEEGCTTAGKLGLQWLLDPIDGTANFIKGIPLYSMSLALAIDNRPILGIIDVPANGGRYIAAEGYGAFYGDTPIRVRPTEELRTATVTVGDYAVGERAETKNELRLVVNGRLAQRALRVRMLGSAAIDLAWLAHGRTDAAVIFGGKAWDVAAGVILVREAGGIVIDGIGAKHTLRSTSTIAASPQLAGQVLDVMPRFGPGQPA